MVIEQHVQRNCEPDEKEQKVVPCKWFYEESNKVTV